MDSLEARNSRRPPVIREGLTLVERQALLDAGYIETEVEQGIDDRGHIIALLLLRSDAATLRSVFGFDEESLEELACGHSLGPTGSDIKRNGKK